MRGQSLQAIERDLGVAEVGVPISDSIPPRSRELCLEREHPPRVLGGTGEVRELKHRFNVVLIPRPDVDACRVREEIEIPCREPEAPLADRDNVPIALFGVWSHLDEQWYPDS